MAIMSLDDSSLLADSQLTLVVWVLKVDTELSLINGSDKLEQCLCQ